MPAATRVVLAPPEAWDEEQILAAARALPVPAGALRPGDAFGPLIVIGVDPQPGAEAHRETVLEIDPNPRPLGGATLDVAVMLDASESMSQPWSESHTRWSAACDAIRAFLDNPGAPLRTVSLFIYARDAQLVAGPVADAKVRLPEVVPRGRSMTGTSLNTVLAYLAQNSAPNAAQSVLVLSDGAGETAELERAGERAARLGVQVHALLFSPAEDAAFAKLAERTGGSVQLATSPPSFALRYDPPTTEEPSP